MYFLKKYFFPRLFLSKHGYSDADYSVTGEYTQPSQNTTA